MDILNKKQTLLSRIYTKIEFYGDILERKSIYLSLLFIIFISITYFNIKTPLIGDDYVYSFVFSTTERLHSIADIIQSQVIHYNTWGGRSIVHSILQIVLLQNQLIGDILNSMVFIIFLLCIQFHIIGALKSSTWLTFIIFCLIWLLQPAIGETIFWLTGSINYLWGTTIILLFLLPYRLYKGGELTTKLNILYSLLIFVSGIIAGWTNENTAAGMIAITIGFIFYYRLNHWKTPIWSYLGVIGAIIGFTIMILAPGNYLRASEAGPTTLFHLVYRTFTYTDYAISYLGTLNLGLAVILILYINFCTSERKFHKISITLIYILGVFISIYSMVLSPGFPPRTWFGVITLNIIAFGYLLYQIDYKIKFLNSIKYCLLFFCFTNILFNIYNANKDINEINNIWKKRLHTIINAKNKNLSSVTFEGYKANTKYGMSDAPYANRYISNYYGIEFNIQKKEEKKIY